MSTTPMPRLHEQVFIIEGPPQEAIRSIIKKRKTGALTINFNRGGICKGTQWREKVDRQRDSG